MCGSGLSESLWFGTLKESEARDTTGFVAEDCEEVCDSRLVRMVLRTMRDSKCLMTVKDDYVFAK